MGGEFVSSPFRLETEAQCLSGALTTCKGERTGSAPHAALHRYEDVLVLIWTCLQLYHALQIFKERAFLFCQNVLSSLCFLKSKFLQIVVYLVHSYDR